MYTLFLNFEELVYPMEIIFLVKSRYLCVYFDRELLIIGGVNVKDQLDVLQRGVSWTITYSCCL